MLLTMASFENVRKLKDFDLKDSLPRILSMNVAKSFLTALCQIELKFFKLFSYKIITPDIKKIRPCSKQAMLNHLNSLIDYNAILAERNVFGFTF